MKENQYNQVLLKLKQIHVKFISMLLIVIFFLSCSQQKSKTEQKLQYLTGNNEKYWIAIEPYDDETEASRIGIVLRRDNSYDHWYTHEKNTRFFLNQLENQRWSIKNDSIIEIKKEGWEPVVFKIEYLNDDIMIITNLERKQLEFYKKAKNQHIKPIKNTTNLFPTTY